MLPGVASFKISVKGNTAPVINGFIEALTVAPGQKKQIVLGKANDDETPGKISLLEFKARCK